MDFVVKVQVPLGSNSAMPGAWVYNKDRSIQVMMPVDSVKEKMGDSAKKYFNATIVKGGKIILLDEAPAQDW